ncbi:BON domain-containing protein [Ramlibacter alkalitolerans]|uniref:BON domain-containing protein n=1 Tax=Ramlibacter alkalitolerans TaxID=2039631 RepID=A0ABS1JPZ7_9BURK|nr:BON domain-containing protein [Ramlibacter alkalitolerans]MBL0426327.1 BON domain-containing protein [Ramlibacter alkalitolerans]
MGWKRPATAAGMVMLLALAACGDRVENTEMPQPEQASVEINRQGMEGAKEENQAQGVENNTSTMGAAAEQSARTEDADAKIASDVQSSLANDPDLAAMKIDVHSRDGTVTLVGRAPDPAARDRAGQLARGVAGVKTVDNLLTLG